MHANVSLSLHSIKPTHTAASNHPPSHPPAHSLTRPQLDIRKPQQQQPPPPQYLHGRFTKQPVALLHLTLSLPLQSKVETLAQYRLGELGARAETGRPQVAMVD